MKLRIRQLITGLLQPSLVLEAFSDFYFFFIVWGGKLAVQIEEKFQVHTVLMKELLVCTCLYIYQNFFYVREGTLIQLQEV